MGGEKSSAGLAGLRVVSGTFAVSLRFLGGFLRGGAVHKDHFFSFNAQPVPMNDNNTTIATSRRISIPNNSQDKSSKGRFDGVAFYTDDLTMSFSATWLQLASLGAGTL